MWGVYTHKYVSRWLILLIDLAIIAVAYLFTAIVSSNLSPESFNWAEAMEGLFFITGIKLICFLIFKTYKGAVRYTAFTDLIGFFKALSVSTFLLVLLRYSTDIFNVSTTSLVLNTLCSFFLLIAFRITVKNIFRKFSRNHETKNVLIYGAGDHGILTFNALNNDNQFRYNVLGFIDDNPSKRGKNLLGKKIFNLKGALRLIAKHHSVDEVILAIQNIDSNRKKRIINVFLQKKISIKNVPSSYNWINGRLSSEQITKIRIEDLLEREPIQLDNCNIKADVKGKVILVTGAAGSIGSEIVRQLLHYNPKKIVLLDQAESALYDLKNDVVRLNPEFESKIQLKICDVSNKVAIERVFKNQKFDIVYHAAAYKHVPMMEDNPFEAILVNVFGTKNLADLAMESYVEKFVFVSTDKAVNPTNVMGATKRVAEIYIQSLNERKSTKFITTRFGNVLGSNGSVVPLFRKQIEAGGPLTVTDARITRYFMTIPEACQLVLEAGAMGKGGEIYVFDMGESVKIIEIAKKMIELYGYEVDTDIKIKITGLRPGEKLYEELLTKEENTLPTHHPKIMIGRVRQYAIEKVARDFEELEYLLLNGGNEDVVYKLKNIVPEFKSNNSQYESLDNNALMKVG
ncbi:polysaccharide biosynthesis protein [Nafulsella turpanensis]|uniref:polysaccharide biosynthesis protein n=1 Tax=Nafulsella turpanensis TaxID=1265690 RepID=UPI00037C1B37|nr:nucleoside-diphosphate sugar epimerase/dehydratase [Nafulsella turpanensis]